MSDKINKEIAKKILDEMSLIDDAEVDPDDRWYTLKGYLEAVVKIESLGNEVLPDETTREMIDRDVCPSCTWRGDVELDNGVCPYCHTDWDKLLDEDEERADNG